MKGVFIFLLTFWILETQGAEFSYQSAQDTTIAPVNTRQKGGGRGDGTGGGHGTGGGNRKGRDASRIQVIEMPDGLDELISDSLASVPTKDGQNSRIVQKIQTLDTVRIIQLIQIASRYLYIDTDSLLMYAEAAKRRSDEGSYLNGQIESRLIMIKELVNALKANEGLELCQEILQITENDSSKIPPSIYYWIALSHDLKGQKEDAEINWRLSVQMQQERGDTLALMVAYLEFAQFYENWNKPDQAIELSQECLKIAEEAKNYVAVYALLGNIGRYYSTKGDFATAIDYLNRSLRLRQEHFRPVSVAYAYYHLQQAHLLAGNYEESIENGEKAAETLAGNPGTSLLMLSLTATEEAYQAMDGEMPNFRNLIKKSDAIFTSDDEWLMHRRQMSSLYNAEKTDEYIDYQKSEIGALEEENVFQRRLLWLISGGLVLIFGVGFLIRSRNFARKEKRIQEKFSHELLKYQEEERKRISRDLHDSIGQSLVLIKNRIQLQDAESTVMLTETLEEVRSISRQLHPVLLEKLGLTAAIEKVVSDADQNSDIFIDSEIEQVDGLFKPEDQLHIYRIVQESVANMLKHSNAKSASVKVKVRDKDIHFEVKDHGVGFDLIADPSKLSSLGMQTLKERTKILGGKLLIESNTGVGTSIVLVLKKVSIE